MPAFQRGVAYILVVASLCGVEVLKYQLKPQDTACIRIIQHGLAPQERPERPPFIYRLVNGVNRLEDGVLSER